MTLLDTAIQWTPLCQAMRAIRQILNKRVFVLHLHFCLQISGLDNVVNILCVMGLRLCENVFKKSE